MKIRIMLPAVMSCLALLSVSGFAEPSKLNTKCAASTNGNNQGPACSSMDLSVFEEADEEQTYNDLGFSRGDIKSLYNYKYDPKSEQTVSGNIIKVLRVQFPDENCYLIAVLKTDNGDFLVNLGPVWFADENNIAINEGDTIQVKGSKIRTNGRHIIIASEIKKNGQSLVLRNQNGSAQWGSPKAQKGAASA